MPMCPVLGYLTPDEWDETYGERARPGEPCLRPSAVEPEAKPAKPPAEIVQDHAYWLSIYPNGNFPLGVLD